MSSGTPTARTVAAGIAGEKPEISRSLTVQWQDPMASAEEGMKLAGLDYMKSVLNREIPLRPLTRDTGIVRAEGEVTYRGRRQATSDARLYAEESGKLLASATSTCMILG